MALDHLVAYGTLRPGEENHWVVRSIPGEWRPAKVRGWVYPLGFGPAEGHPGFTPDPDGPEVEVMVLSSSELDRHLGGIDRFEGPGYRRVRIEATIADADAPVTAWIHEADPHAE